MNRLAVLALAGPLTTNQLLLGAVIVAAVLLAEHFAYRLDKRDEPRRRRVIGPGPKPR